MGCCVSAAEIAVVEKATGGLDDQTGAEGHFETERVRFEIAEEGQVGIVDGHFEIEVEGPLVEIVEEGHSGRVRARPGTEAAH